MNWGVSGWKGPYIKAPISHGDNPFNSTVYMYANLWGGSAPPHNFDLNADGTDDRSGPGNFVGFAGVPSSVAKMADDRIDGNMGTSDWQNTGKVEYHGSWLCLYLFQ
jgi:hypothetical protein